MNIEIKKLKKLAKQKEKENWKLRAFLKWEHIPTKKVDQMVHELFKECSSQIDCTQCANCCVDTFSVLNSHDIARLVDHLKIQPNDIKKQYLQKADEGDFVFNKKPCPFLSNKKYLIYESRPDDCRSYPRLDKPNFASRSIQAVQNTLICPLVYQVLEGLKSKIDLSEFDENDK